MPLEPCVAETPLFERAQAEVVDENVGLCDQARENFLSRRHRHVERKRTLVAVDAEEIDGVAGEKRRAPGASVVTALWRLDLDDVGAHVAEHHGAQRPGQDAGEIEHADAGERAVGGSGHRLKPASCASTAAR